MCFSCVRVSGKTKTHPVVGSRTVAPGQSATPNLTTTGISLMFPFSIPIAVPCADLGDALR
jgi:hypothetical protein